MGASYQEILRRHRESNPEHAAVGSRGRNLAIEAENGGGERVTVLHADTARDDPHVARAFKKRRAIGWEEAADLLGAVGHDDLSDRAIKDLLQDVGCDRIGSTWVVQKDDVYKIIGILDEERDGIEGDEDEER